MSSENFFSVEPAEIRFSDELKIHICKLLVSNNSNKRVAIKVLTTNFRKYRFHISNYVLLPWSTCQVIVKTREECAFPTDVQCKDKFVILCAITNARTTEKDDLSYFFEKPVGTLVQECRLNVVSTHHDPSLVPERLKDGSSTRASVSDDNTKADEEPQEQSSEFNKESGYLIQERKLKVAHVSPSQPPSSILERLDEGPSPSTPVSDDGYSNTSDLTSIAKEDKEPKKQSSESAIDERTNARSESIENLIRLLAMDKPMQFSHADLISFTSNLSTKLGSGAFGNVYKGQFLNGVEIAVKVLIENEVVEEEFMAEVSTMGRTYHRNLVKLYGFCFDDNMKALVYQYASNGSLDHVLYENRFDLKWEELYGIAVETAKALVYLHDGCYEKIIHHDIKPANVLLDSNFSPKITDFGLAKLMTRNVSHFTMSRIRGTPGYAAPETCMPSSKITYKCDVYSFGVMLFEILGRRRNVIKETWFPKQVWEKFENEQLDEIIVDCGITVENRKKAKILCMVALWCIQFTPETRPSMNTVSTMLEKEIQVTRPPNPFLSSLPISSMQPS